MSGKIKLEKGIEKKSLDGKKLDNGDLEKIAGGFIEYEGYANGHTIKCPFCHNEIEANFSWWVCPDYNQNGYECKCCGGQFWVSDTGYYYDINNNMMPFKSWD